MNKIINWWQTSNTFSTSTLVCFNCIYVVDVDPTEVQYFNIGRDNKCNKCFVKNSTVSWSKTPENRPNPSMTCKQWYHHHHRTSVLPCQFGFDDLTIWRFVSCPNKQNLHQHFWLLSSTARAGSPPWLNGTNWPILCWRAVKHQTINQSFRLPRITIPSPFTKYT